MTDTFIEQDGNNALFHNNAKVEEVGAPLKALPQHVIDYLKEHLDNFLIISVNKEDCSGTAVVNYDAESVVRNFIGVANYTLREVYNRMRTTIEGTES